MVILPNGCYCSDISVTPKNWKKCSKKSLEQTWYVHYRFYDPNVTKDGKISPKPVVKKGMNSFTTLEDRRKKTEEIIEEELSKLKNGYNPHFDKETYESQSTTESKDPSKTPISDFINVSEVEDYPDNTSLLTSSHQEITEIKLNTLPSNFNIISTSPFFPSMWKVLDISDFENEVKICIRSVLKYSFIAAQQLKIQDTPLEKITPLYIKALLEQLKKVKGEEMTNRTFNFYRSHLMMVFRCLKTWKVISSNPVENIEQKDHEVATRTVLTPEERKLVDQFLKIHNYRFWLVVNIFFHSGIRRNELMRLKGRHVDLKKLTLSVLVLKGKRRMQSKPIKAICKTLWEEALQDCQPNQYIFGEGLLPADKSIHPRQITRRWKYWIKNKLGITPDFYSLKHLNTDEVSARLDIEHAAQLNSQFDLNITKIYAVTEEERRKIRIQKLGNPFVPLQAKSDNITLDREKRLLSVLHAKCLEVCTPDKITPEAWDILLLNCTLLNISSTVASWHFKPEELLSLFSSLIEKKKLNIYTIEFLQSFIPAEYSYPIAC